MRLSLMAVIVISNIAVGNLSHNALAQPDMTRFWDHSATMSTGSARVRRCQSVGRAFVTQYAHGSQLFWSGATTRYYVYPLQRWMSAMEISLAVIAVAGIAIALVLRRRRSIDRDVAGTKRSTASARKLAREAETTAANIDRFIASARADAFARGRRKAEDEWKDINRG